ncbi:hypothetical protein FBQ81_12705 [Chloroflexi bacterium CFX6]|nr:hypothetical protein [Chloroflexi bacterium CFX6]
MNRNHITRIERLEETARRRQAENAVYELFEMDNKIVAPSTWTQKHGMKRGEPIEFETPRAALDWVMSQMDETAQAQIYLDDVRDLMSDDERLIFDAVYFDAPDYKVMFDIRRGTDALAEAVRLWRHFTNVVKYADWWEAVEARITALLQSLDNGDDMEGVPV